MGHKPLRTRFYEKLKPGAPDECWPWPGGRLASGYGLIRDSGRCLLAHRLSWKYHNGRSVPDGMVVLHACDNPCCVNPAHLSIGTKADNSADMRVKERQARGTRVANAKLTEDVVREIRRLRASGDSSLVLAKKFGIGRTYVDAIVGSRRWQHVA